MLRRVEAAHLEQFLSPGLLLALAAVGWWISAQMATSMMRGSMTMAKESISLAAFVGAWISMMAAMMLPAIIPVVRLYKMAATRGQVAPTSFFVVGYLVIWSTVAVPVFFAWRALRSPIADGAPWVARVTALVLLVAALYQVSPLKSACLRSCRSPLGFFMRQRSDLSSPFGAVKAGIAHGLVCLGCCWALFAVLVSLGTMQLMWMIGLSVLIFIEKVTRIGERAAVLGAAAFFALGVALLVHPELISRIT